MLNNSAKIQTNDHKICFLNERSTIRCWSRTAESSRISQRQIRYSNSTCTQSRSGAVDDWRSMFEVSKEASHMFIIDWFVLKFPCNTITVVFEDACQCGIRTSFCYHILRTNDCDASCMQYNNTPTCWMWSRWRRLCLGTISTFLLAQSWLKAINVSNGGCGIYLL